MANLTKREQLWMSEKWYEKFGRPGSARDTGGGHKPEDLARFTSPGAETLLGYNRAVLARIKDYLRAIRLSDLDKDMEGTPFNPPPKIANSLVGLLNDGLQHAGQTWYIRGLRQGMGWH